MKIVGIIVVVVLIAAGVYYFMVGNNETGKSVETEQDSASENASEPTANEAGNVSGDTSVKTDVSADVSVSAPSAASVTIKDFAFGPKAVKIKAGGAVTWTHNDLAGHTVTADDGSWGSKVLSQGKTFTQVFAKAGTYTYHCEPHPSMKGTVVVE